MGARAMGARATGTPAMDVGPPPIAGATSASAGRGAGCRGAADDSRSTGPCFTHSREFGDHEAVKATRGRRWRRWLIPLAGGPLVWLLYLAASIAWYAGVSDPG